MENKTDKWWGYLTAGILLALVLFAGYCLKTGKSLEGIAIIIGVLIGKLGTLIDFKYGSSSGSKEKTELMAKENGMAGGEKDNTG